MELSQEQIASILQDAKPSIIAGLKDQVIQQVKWESNNLISKMIQEEVSAFMAAEVIPHLKSNLIESKDGLIAIAVNASQSIVEDLTKSMAGELKGRLETSYKRQQIFKALFD